MIICLYDCGFPVAIAVAVPTIGPFIGLIGAFCFSLLGIIMPVLIEFTTYWDNVTVWMTVRNAVLIVVGLMALIFGTINSITDIITAYEPNATRTVHSTINSTLIHLTTQWPEIRLHYNILKCSARCSLTEPAN